jgi:hypothetical protein
LIIGVEMRQMMRMIIPKTALVPAFMVQPKSNRHRLQVRAWAKPGVGFSLRRTLWCLRREIVGGGESASGGRREIGHRHGAAGAGAGEAAGRKAGIMNYEL